MKAFKKWRKEDVYSEICGHDWHNGAELAWKAALEWVKREAISLDERVDVSRNVINRELEI